MRKNNYEYFYNSLLKTSTGQDLKEKTYSNLKNLELIKYDFKGHENTALPIFYIKFGSVLHNAYRYFYSLPLWKLVSVDETNLIIENHIEKDIPNYRCSKQVALFGGFVNKGRKQCSFHNWIISHFEDCFCDLKVKKNREIAKQIKSIINLDEFKSKQDNAIKRCAINSIVKVLMKYDSLPTSIIERGISSYVDIKIIQ